MINANRLTGDKVKCRMAALLATLGKEKAMIIQELSVEHMMKERRLAEKLIKALLEGGMDEGLALEYVCRCSELYYEINIETLAETAARLDHAN